MKKHTNPTWIIEKDSFPDQENKMIEEINKNGNEYILEDINKIQPFKKNGCIITYGSIKFIEKISKITENSKYKYTPLHYSNFVKYDYSYYFNSLKNILLNDNVIFTTISVFKKNISNFFKKNNELFLKSNSSKKKFPGISLKKENAIEELERYSKIYETNENEVIVISNYKKIKREWRFVVGNGEIIDGCLYASYDVSFDLNLYLEEAKKYANSILNTLSCVSFDNVYTLDVCILFDKTFHVVEINSFSCAGLYDCDMNKIIKNVSKIAEYDFMNS